jgi:hypothetical protein
MKESINNRKQERDKETRSKDGQKDGKETTWPFAGVMRVPGAVSRNTPQSITAPTTRARRLYISIIGLSTRKHDTPAGYLPLITFPGEWNSEQRARNAFNI